MEWSIIKGSLPPGLSLNKSTGIITGTPKSTTEGRTGDYIVQYPFEVIVKDLETELSSDPKAFSFEIYEPPIIETGKVLQDGYVGKEYKAELYATGTKVGMYWKLASGSSLPEGLEIEKQSSHYYGYRTTTISGTPKKSGKFTFTVEVEAGLEAIVHLKVPAMITSKEFQITVTVSVFQQYPEDSSSTRGTQATVW